MSKDENKRAKRANNILFAIIKYANVWGFCCRRRRGCLSSLILSETRLSMELRDKCLSTFHSNSAIVKTTSRKCRPLSLRKTVIHE